MFLGIKANTQSSWYARNTFDFDLILHKCEFLNPDWLLTGNGPMLKTDITNNNQLNTESMTIEDELRELKNKVRFLEDQMAFYVREHREFVRREEMEGFFARNGGNLNKQTIA